MNENENTIQDGGQQSSSFSGESQCGKEKEHEAGTRAPQGPEGLAYKARKHKTTEIRIGEKYGRWTILGDAGMRNPGRRGSCSMVKAVCSCGTERIMLMSFLISGNTRSCGCYRAEISTQKATIHGLCGTPIYKTWATMLRRCRNVKGVYSKHYALRGITVCERWKVLENFVNDMGPYQPGKSLDRIDNDKGYSPENCRWATWKEQARNKRSNRMVAYRDRMMSMMEAAEISGIGYYALRARLRRGWTEDMALSTPTRAMKQPAKNCGKLS